MATTYREGQVIHHEGNTPPPMDRAPSATEKTTAGDVPAGQAPETPAAEPDRIPAPQPEPDAPIADAAPEPKKARARKVAVKPAKAAKKRR